MKYLNSDGGSIARVFGFLVAVWAELMLPRCLARDSGRMHGQTIRFEAVESLMVTTIVTNGELKIVWQDMGAPEAPAPLGHKGIVWYMFLLRWLPQVWFCGAASLVSQCFCRHPLLV